MTTIKETIVEVGFGVAELCTKIDLVCAVLEDQKLSIARETQTLETMLQILRSMNHNRTESKLMDENSSIVEDSSNPTDSQLVSHSVQSTLILEIESKVIPLVDAEYIHVVDVVDMEFDLHHYPEFVDAVKLNESKHDDVNSVMDLSVGVVKDIQNFWPPPVRQNTSMDLKIFKPPDKPPDIVLIYAPWVPDRGVATIQSEVGLTLGLTNNEGSMKLLLWNSSSNINNIITDFMCKAEARFQNQGVFMNVRTSSRASPTWSFDSCEDLNRQAVVARVDPVQCGKIKPRLINLQTVLLGHKSYVTEVINPIMNWLSRRDMEVLRPIKNNEGVITWTWPLLQCALVPDLVLAKHINSRGEVNLESGTEKLLVAADSTYFTVVFDFLESSGAVGASSLLIVYSLDYARTRLVSDAKAANKIGGREFDCLIDVYHKTLKSDRTAGLYYGFDISGAGVIVYRGLFLGTFDGPQPYQRVSAPNIAPKFSNNRYFVHKADSWIHGVCPTDFSAVKLVGHSTSFYWLVKKCSIVSGIFSCIISFIVVQGGLNVEDWTDFHPSSEMVLLVNFGSESKLPYEALAQLHAQKIRRAAVNLDIVEMLNGLGMGEASLLTPLLATGQLRRIGTSTMEEFRKYVERDAEFEKLFRQVYVVEPSVADTIRIIRGLKEKYEGYQGVKIQDCELERQTRTHIVWNWSKKKTHTRGWLSMTFSLDDAPDIIKAMNGFAPCEDTKLLKKKNKIKEVSHGLGEINKKKSIWMRKPEEVSTKDYVSSYKIPTNVSKDLSDGKQSSVEGQLEFKTIMFNPGSAPFDIFDAHMKMKNTKLIVRMVFIRASLEELITECLGFIKGAEGLGVADFDDVPLNIFEWSDGMAENKECYSKLNEAFAKNQKLGMSCTF